MQKPGNLFWAGVRAELPLALGVLPFGMIYGVLALSAGMSPSVSQAMSSIVFAGSSQFITTQLVAQGTPALVIVFTIAIVNLRHALYSASLAPYLHDLSPFWKGLLAYLLTDEAYAITITHFQSVENPAFRHFFMLGAGLTLWTVWQVSTAAGIFLGNVIPSSWSLDFALPVTFIALVVPALKDRAALAAALAAGVVAILAFGMPYKLGLAAAAVIGIAAGTLLEGRK